MFGGIPFEHFAGGIPGVGMGMPGAQKEVDTEELYNILEVPKDATGKEIRKSYLKLSRLHHPDKGGDDQKFKEISAAHEILSDSEKRKLYDQYGIEGVEDGAPSAGNDDIFSQLFGGRGRRKPPGHAKGPALNHPIKVSLDDLYNGKTVKLAINRKVVVGEVRKCESCDGQGLKMEIRQIGPGMIQQIQKQCSACNGQGNLAKIKKERKVLEVYIEKGMKDGHKITFKGMGDEAPGLEAGDINFIVQVKSHNVFKRQGADLLIQKELSLNQALCGFAFKITHLDGRQIVIRSKPGEVIRSASNEEGSRVIPFSKIVPNEGMPSKGNPFVKGNLYIIFKVKFPEDDSLKPEQIRVLKEILPDPDMDAEFDENEVEEVHMSKADLGQFGKGGADAANEHAYDSDDGEPQPVQCQQS